MDCSRLDVANLVMETESYLDSLINLTLTFYNRFLSCEALYFFCKYMDYKSNILTYFSQNLYIFSTLL